MLLELRVARAWQVPPTKLREWSQEDRNMAAALLAHEADLGPCGFPHRVTTDPDLDGWIDIDEENAKVCVACAALDRYRDDTPPDRREPGQLVQLVDNRHLMNRREERP
jgi:hypothetical protein